MSLFLTCRDSLTMSAHRVPAQPVDATQALNLSAGVSNCSRGGASNSAERSKRGSSHGDHRTSAFPKRILSRDGFYSRQTSAASSRVIRPDPL